MPLWARRGLESEYSAEAAADLGHEGFRQVADGCLKVSLVKGDQGSDVDDGVLGQAGDGGGHEDVAGHGGQGCIGRDNGGDGGIQPAGVEGIGLDDQHRAPFSWSAAAGLAEIGPADAAALGHQSARAAR